MLKQNHRLRGSLKSYLSCYDIKTVDVGGIDMIRQDMIELTVIFAASADLVVISAIAPGATRTTTTRDSVADRPTLTTASGPGLKVFNGRRYGNSNGEGRETEHGKSRDDGSAHLDG